ncbi:unnamed protein product [Lymnaea stagnalis]|uniref:DUF4201 domain-containing protein n=1 Tax=Lymnaea stagnalis TaxID=6523 RepID=A0AAV2H6N5_LYMST
MRHRKLRLEYLLKIADERMVLLTDEFILAQRSEAMEASIEQKIVESNKEKKECSSHVKVLAKKQDIIKKDIDACAKQKAALLAEVTQIAIKAPGFEKYLTRVFNKKLAKPAKAPTVDVSSDPSLAESDEESESSSDMDIEDDDEDDDGLDVDLPPSELNKDVYDQVVEVRLKRFAVDETEAAARESYDEVTASINTLKTRIKEADKSLDSGKRDLEAFIKEKQSKQNNLDCAVSLKLNQIFVLDADLKEALCTGHDTIQQLRNRIPELRREMTLQKRKGQEIKKQHFQLQQEKHKFLLRLEVMKKRCDTEMLKKFGAVTAIEDLENFTIDPDIKVLQKDLEKEEDEHGADMVKLTSLHRRAIGQRVDEMNKQAERMYGKAEMLQQVNEMTKEMDEQMRNLPTEYEDLTTRKEIKFLSKVVRDQQRIINTLKMEITKMTSRRVTPLPPILPPITRAQ